jgi:hypothetical protein
MVGGLELGGRDVAAGPWRRSAFHQATQAAVASSTWSTVRHAAAVALLAIAVIVPTIIADPRLPLTSAAMPLCCKA